MPFIPGSAARWIADSKSRHFYAAALLADSTYHASQDLCDRQHYRPALSALTA